MLVENNIRREIGHMKALKTLEKGFFVAMFISIVYIAITILPDRVDAAHTLDVRSSCYNGSPLGGGTTTNPVAWPTLTTTSGDTVVVLGIAVTNGQTPRTGGNPTFGGNAMSQAATVLAATEGTVEVWYLLDPPIGANTFSVPNSGTVPLAITAMGFKAQSGYISALDASTTAGNAAGSTNPSASITTTVAGDALFAALFTGAQTWSPTAQSGIALCSADTGSQGYATQYGLWSSSGATSTSWTFGTSDDWAIVTAAFKEVVKTTVIGNGASEPSNVTLGPGGSITDLDNFTLNTNGALDTITAMTVTLSPANAYTNIAQVDVTDTSNTTKCTSNTSFSSNTVSMTGCNILVYATTTNTYKIRITPKTAANMATPATGASYDVTGTITEWTGSNATHSGSDSGSATVTIDNLSAGNVTSASVTAGDTQNSLTWTNPADSDLEDVLVLASTTAVTFVPVEGTEYSTSTLSNGTRVACYGKQTYCTDTGRANGTAYYYKIYTEDLFHNFSNGGASVTGSPATPAAAVAVGLSHYGWRNDNGGETSASFVTSQDSAISTNVVPGDRIRLRMGLSITNSSANNYNYRLEYSSSTCTVWVPVPSYGSNVNEHWVMDYSPYVANLASTTDNAYITNAGGSTFAAGYLMTSGYQTPAQTIAKDYFTEMEYAVKSTILSEVGLLYCFRLTNGGTATFFTYSVQPQITLSAVAQRNNPKGGQGTDFGNTGTLRVGGVNRGASQGNSANAGNEEVGNGNPVGGGSSGGGGGVE